MVEGMELQTSEKTEKIEKADFSIILHPHRSLSERSFLILMICIGIVSFGTGLIFMAMGAWPVLGFFGLDVFLVYLAFRLNFRAGRTCEIVEIIGDQLTVRKLSPDGKEVRKNIQAYWSRLKLDSGRLFVVCKMEQIEIGHFLVEQEKEEVKDAIIAALYRYRDSNIN